MNKDVYEMKKEERYVNKCNECQMDFVVSVISDRYDYDGSARSTIFIKDQVAKYCYFCGSKI